jgi:hypothetical protein
MRLVNFRTLIVAAGAIALTACGDDVTIEDQTNVQLTLSSATCSVGQTVQLLATVNGSNSSTTPVTYAVAPATGVVTLSGTTLTCAAPGSAIVTATVGNRTAQAAITVTPAQNPVQSIQLVPDAFTINVGGTQTITPVVTGNPGANTAVNYRSADTTIATVNAAGVVTGRRVGITTIIATSVASPNIQAAAQVTVSQSSVQSITVTPSTVQLAPGNTITVVPNVQAPAGVSRAVTYLSNNTAVATVSATGVITAVSNGTAVITVASVADPSFSTQVTVNVQEAAAVRVTIQSVTANNPVSGVAAPVNPDSVSGPITVTLNVDPGAQRLSRVEVLLGGVTVCTQSFSAAFAEALIMSELNGSADVQPIQCTINTAQADSLGIARNVNGARLLQARVFTSSAAGAAPTQTATIQTQLTLRNVNTFSSRITTTPAANQVAQALDPAGRLWRAGSVVVRAYPVLYDSGSAASQLTVRIGSRPSRTATTRDSTGAFVITFPGASANDTVAGQTTLTGYTTPTAIAALQGDTVVVVGSVAGGGAGPSGNVLGFVRIDNQNPEIPTTFALNQNVATAVAGQTGTFINASFSFDSAGIIRYTAGDDGDNGGVDDVRAEFFAGTAASCTTATNVACTGFTRIRSGADLAPSIANTTYRLQARVIDRLGNFRTVDLQDPSGANRLNFGIDITAPTLAFGGTNAGGSTGTFTAGTTGGQIFDVLGSDDASGVDPLAGYRVSLTRLRTNPDTATGAVVRECLNPNTNVVLTNTSGFGTINTANCPAIATDGTLATPSTNGYYTYSAFAFDAAGNRSAGTLTQRVLVDSKAPNFVGGIAIPALITGGSTVAFSASAQDNLDLIFGRADLLYGNGGPIPGGVTFRLDSTAIGTTADEVLTTTATVTRTINNFVRQIEFVDATNALVAGTAVQPTSIALSVVDGAGSAATLSQALPATNIQAGVSYFTAPAANRIATFSIINAATNVDLSGDATAASGDSNTVTLRAQVTGPSGSLNIPFTRVEFYYAVAPNVYRLLGTATSSAVQEPGGGVRTITYSFVFNPDAPQFAAGATDIIALGVNANGDALATRANTNITIVP